MFLHLLNKDRKFERTISPDYFSLSNTRTLRCVIIYKWKILMKILKESNWSRNLPFNTVDEKQMIASVNIIFINTILIIIMI